MGMEVVKMAKNEKVRMKVGITVPVGPALRALFREAEKVEIQALASRHARDRAERWGWDLEPTHLAFAAGNTTLAFGGEGPTLLSPDDVPLSKPLTIQGIALEVARRFLKEMEGKRITLHLGPSTLSVLNRYLGSQDSSYYEEELELSIVAPDSYGGYDKVKVLEGGGVSVVVSWGEPSWWDGWAVSPDGEVEYVGTVDGPRYRPVWLERALEEFKAKGA